jgi:ribonuclease T2
MPGVQSGLERHEWTKHGTCAGVSAETFYRRAMALLEAINGSPVRALFAERLGKRVSAREIAAAFDSGFGAGAGDRVDVSCRNDGSRTLVTELQIELEGDVMGAGTLRQLMADAPMVDARCDGGVVDRVGLQ